MHTAEERPFEEHSYYSRQLCLPEVGLAGQARLKQSRVFVVGAGGLGSPVLQYLAAAGVGTLGICDGDVLAPSNLHRQVLYQVADVGQPKALLAQRQLNALNPFIHVRAYPDALTAENAVSRMDAYELILDCTDSYAAKFLLNDTAVRQGKAILHASIYQLEGQVFGYNPSLSGPCLRCLWPEEPAPGCVGTCAEVGVLGAVPGVLGTLQAMEALKYLLGLPSVLATGDMLLVNLLETGIQRLHRSQRTTCPVCAQPGLPIPPPITPPTIQTDGSPWDLDIFDFPPEVLTQKFHLVDIREAWEVAQEALAGLPYTHVPMHDFLQGLDALHSSDKPYLLFCQKGIRTAQVAQLSWAKGIQNIYSVRGGIHPLQQYVHAHAEAFSLQPAGCGEGV